MEILREVKGIQLNKGDSMANGLFNLSLEDTVSFWFDSETKDELLECNDIEFETKALEIIQNSEII